MQEQSSPASTLHHPCCGCPGTLGFPEADADAAATAAAAQVADSLVSNYQQLLRMGAFKAERRLKVAYIIPHHNVTGGLKVLCLHMQLLRQRGHCVVAVHRKASTPPASHAPAHAGSSAAPAGPPRALPPWSSIQVDEEVVLGPEQHLAANYPTQTLDAIICGMFQQVPELLVGLPDSSAAIIYYEQGHEFLFGDPLRAQLSSGYYEADRIFHMVMGLPAVLACVSEPVRELVGAEFGRGRAMVVPNGVDTELFKPAWGMPQNHAGGVAGSGGQAEELAQEQNRQQPCPAALDRAPGTAGEVWRKGFSQPWVMAGLPPPSHVICKSKVLDKGCRPCLLLVGDPGIHLKGFDVAVQVLQLVVAELQHARQQQRQQQQQAYATRQVVLPLLVTWVCQRMPGPELLDVVAAAGEHLVLGVYVQAPQDLLPLLYRSHSALLFTSRYEAWGMPVLEAMASGLAVVATSCSGVLSFTHPGQDCLAAPPGDVAGLTRHVLAVLMDPALRMQLQQKGRATACKYSLPAVVSLLEELLYSAVAASAELQRLRSHPLCQAAASRACVAAIQAGKMMAM